jgi:hypothetical protein
MAFTNHQPDTFTSAASYPNPDQPNELNKSWPAWVIAQTCCSTPADDGRVTPVVAM